ncbi:MAG: tRNA (adenosine(37)-N6)-dimethylallyltransferase MiaA [Candidatus Peregrinibacteria bacterium]|nr:tRNA (adenosine(37)-N6)-dimethylallyltransferase MiaA [Candidatus Peregrinibacteria bacterium]
MIDAFKNWLKEISSNGASVKPPLLVILGPTASGKTALSLKLAHELNGEIISADSRQIYKEIDIGSDKLPLDENRCHDGILHHLIDFVPPEDTYTMGDFKRDAEKVIGEIYARGHLPMLVGGTGLYIRAITDNYDLPAVRIDPELRKKLYAMKKEDLHKLLQEKDPATAAKIHMNNIPYVTRALEIIEGTGAQKSDQTAEPKYNVFMMGIQWPREELFARIDQRVDLQLQRGLVEESRQLIERYGMESRLPSLTSLGLKEFAPYFSGESTLDQVSQKIKTATRQYAKRQINWFRKDESVHWIKSSELDQTLRAILDACLSWENAGS